MECVGALKATPYPGRWTTVLVDYNETIAWIIQQYFESSLTMRRWTSIRRLVTPGAILPSRGGLPAGQYGTGNRILKRDDILRIAASMMTLEETNVQTSLL